LFPIHNSSFDPHFGYGYCLSDPINFVDSDALLGQAVSGAATGVVAGAIMGGGSAMYHGSGVLKGIAGGAIGGAASGFFGGAIGGPVPFGAFTVTLIESWASILLSSGLVAFNVIIYSFKIASGRTKIITSINSFEDNPRVTFLICNVRFMLPPSV